MRKRLSLLLVLSGASAFIFMAGCDQIQNFMHSLKTSKTSAPAATSTQETAASVQGTLLAKVNNEVITLEGFDEKVKALESLSPDIKINTADVRKTYLNDLITQELVFQEAKARGIDKKKEVKDALEEFRKGIMARQLIMDETKGIAVEPSEIEAFYNQYKKEFASPQEAKVREIVVASEAAAKEILISLLQGGDFASVAKEKSTSASASSGGDVGIVKKTDKFDKYREVISTLEAGQVSQVFKGPDGYYIVKVEEKKGGAVPSLTEVYDQIKNGLMTQKQTQRVQELTDKLKRDAKIEIKEDLLR
jgi:peptidyl-prolyl cis-trans isomerase C